MLASARFRHSCPKTGRVTFVGIVAGTLCSLSVCLAQSDSKEAHYTQINRLVTENYESLFNLYCHIHAQPEITFQEEKTGARLANELRKLSFVVTTHVGGFGVVGVFSNGDGPTIMVRTDTDGLPVKEETGLSYASQTTTIDDHGNTVYTMHACGHDMHMTCWVGTARVLTDMKDRWSGTLVMIAQPAEERGMGATAMLRDGLFTKWPRPDYALALHCDAELPAGKIGYREGYAMANVDSVDILVRGYGGHGAYPQRTIDPIVIAAHIVVQLQTIVSRQVPPHDAAVVTVGSIHGGTKHNIIPDRVRLQLTVRSYSDETRDMLIESIKRISKGVALGAGVPEEWLPVVSMDDEFTPSTYNTPELVARSVKVMREILGEEQVLRMEPKTWGEDFGQYGRVEPRIPIFMFTLGAQPQELFVASQKPSGPRLPALHSSLFAPDPEPTIKTGVRAMSATVLCLLQEK